MSIYEDMLILQILKVETNILNLMCLTLILNKFLILMNIYLNPQYHLYHIFYKINIMNIHNIHNIYRIIIAASC